jgi:hypothetical protein
MPKTFRIKIAVLGLALCGVILGLTLPAPTKAADVTCHIEWAPMRDGVRLATEVYLLSDQQGPFPVILQRSPYNRIVPNPGSDCNSAIMMTFARSGYAALNQDARGRYRSEGTMDAMQQEAADGYDAIEWAAAQPWSNGKVGTYGGSYVGLTQWQPAIHTPPHLAAMAPNVTASDYHDHWTYVNGAFDLWFGQSWMLLTFAAEQVQRDLESTGLSPEEVQRRATAWVNAGRRDILTKWVWQLPLKSFSEFRHLAPYYYDWLAHPTYDDFWARMDVEPRYGNVMVPSLNSGGWYDIFQIGTVRNFQRIKVAGGSADARDGSMLVMRASCHACPAGTFAGAIDFGPNNAYDATGLTIRFYERWLKGIDNGIDGEPAVRLFVMVPPDTGTTGSGFWITADEFPLPGTLMTRFNLRSGGNANTRLGDGVLDALLPAAGRADRFVYDPRDPVPTLGGNMCCINDLVASGAFDQSGVELRDDVLVYTSAPLAQDMAVIGPVTVTLWAASSAPDTDFTAKMVDVHPDGFAQNVLDRIVRARYRSGSKLQPSLITAGQAYEYTIPLGNTATVFRAGHRIRLEISSSNFPHFDRNPNTGHPAGQDAKLRTAAQTIYHDAARPSYLELPVVPGITAP